MRPIKFIVSTALYIHPNYRLHIYRYAVDVNKKNARRRPFTHSVAYLAISCSVRINQCARDFIQRVVRYVLFGTCDKIKKIKKKVSSDVNKEHSTVFGHCTI